MRTFLESQSTSCMIYSVMNLYAHPSIKCPQSHFIAAEHANRIIIFVRDFISFVPLSRLTVRNW